MHAHVFRTCDSKSVCYNVGISASLRPRGTVHMEPNFLFVCLTILLSHEVSYRTKFIMLLPTIRNQNYNALKSLLHLTIPWSVLSLWSSHQNKASPTLPCQSVFFRTIQSFHFYFNSPIFIARHSNKRAFNWTC